MKEKYILDDKILSVNIYSSQCFKCEHLTDSTGLKCKAFEKGIPDEILDNTFLHLEKYRTQKNEVLFKKK